MSGLLKMRIAGAAMFCAAALAAGGAALAGTTHAVRDAGFELLRQGDLVSTQLGSDGFIVPGSARETIGDTGSEIVWDFAREESGALLCATGHRGKLVRLVKGKDAEVVAEFNEPELTALAKLPDGDILAAAAPSGNIYRIGADDAITTITTLKASFVWRMLPDADGAVWAATGPEGKLFRIRPNGNEAQVDEIADLKSTNLLDLWIDEKGAMGERGALIVAGQDPGWLYRVDAGSKKSEVLFNAEAEEIRAIAPFQGGLALALNTDRSPTAKALELTYRMSGNTPESPDPSSPIPSLAEALKPGAGAGSYGPPRCEVVLLSPEGFRRQLWASEQRPIHALIADKSGENLLAAVGSEGLLMRIAPDGVSAIAADLREDFLMRVVREGDQYLIGTARNGTAIAMDAAPRSEAEYVSRPIDAGAPVRWGKAWWQGRLGEGQSARIAFRVGNDGDAESELWGEWTSPRSLHALDPAPLPERVARYLQYRLTLEGGGATPPRSEYLEAFYALPNAAPLIRNVTASEADATGAAAPPAGAKGAKSAAGGAVEAAGRDPRTNPMRIKIDWQAMDPNQDELEYAVFFRASDETEWKKIDDELKETTLTIESGGVADGRYRFRVVASDKTDNPPGEALQVEGISNELIVDNTPPVFGKMNIDSGDDACTVRFEVSDKVSMVSAVRVDCDNGSVSELVPEDGLYDDRTENFVYRSGKLPIGEHVATFSATDRNGNTSIGRAVFEIK